ncbi:MAG: branched-chain amino acid ABC transporter permease [Chloroflexi bacterium]|nr:branched-chain amino acid ABC transporter permease [Chloroflexota bacterium]
MSANIRPAGVFDVNYGQDISLNRTRGDRWLANGLFLLLLLVPLLTVEGPLGVNLIPQSWIGLIVRIAIYVIAVQGLNILTGYTGQISLGHAAFMAVGAYSAAIFARNLGFPFWVALPAAALFTGLVGLLFGLPSLRVKGFYLAMATLAAQFIIPWLLRYPLTPLTNGSRPLEVPIPTLGPLSFAHESAFYYIAVPLSVFLMLAARNIMRTRTGRAFISIRDNDLAAELLGINVFAYKLQAFFLSALYAGIAGVLLAFNDNSLSLDKFSLGLSIEFLAMLVIGGAGFPLGPLFGVAFVNLLNQEIIPNRLIPALGGVLPQLLPFIDRINIISALSPLLFGFILVVFLILAPRGLAHRWEIFKIAWKIRPYSH